MNKVVEVKGVKIGEGMPKVCVSIIGRTITDIIEEVNFLKNIDFDVLEWRVDFFEYVINIDEVKKTLKEIIKILDNKPIIFTFRSLKEGGQIKVSKEFYIELNKSIIKTNLIDIVDIELFNEEKDIKELIEIAHFHNVAVIISNHDFEKTPSREELISRLCKAIELGGDIPKVAVMPNSSKDVITLLDATRIMKENYTNGPLITMSMSGKGVISRLSGELFGSDLTFGSAKQASAPGQISVSDLNEIIKLIHNNLKY